MVAAHRLAQTCLSIRHGRSCYLKYQLQTDRGTGGASHRFVQVGALLHVSRLELCQDLGFDKWVQNSANISQSDAMNKKYYYICTNMMIINNNVHIFS